MKKTLSLILCVMMLYSLLPIVVLADVIPDILDAAIVSVDGITTTYNLDLLDESQLPIPEEPLEQGMMMNIPEQASQLIFDNGYFFSIKGIEFLNSIGGTTFSLSNSGIVNTITIEKNTEQNIPANIIVALYDSNKKLDEVKIVNIPTDIVSSQEYTYDLDMNLPPDITNYTLKAYVWAGVSTIKPYSKIYNTDINSQLSVEVIDGQQIILNVTATNIESFVDKEFTVLYDSNYIDLIDAVGDTVDVEEIEDSDITILENSLGKLRFSVNKNIPLNKTWSGVLNKIKFVGTQTATSTITISSN